MVCVCIRERVRKREMGWSREGVKEAVMCPIDVLLRYPYLCILGLLSRVVKAGVKAHRVPKGCPS